MSAYMALTPTHSSAAEIVMRYLILTAVAIMGAAAQQTVAPTPEPAGSARGETWAGYNVVDSVETGYRLALRGGNIPQYRSSVNYGNGIRLLSSYFSMNSKEGHGRFFDEIVITTQGLGNDPYESASLRIQKNRIYRYDMSWRLNDYFNPGLTTAGAGGQHFLNTQYRLQDHDLTLFPDKAFKFFVGYTGSVQTGPAFSSTQLFNNAAPITPLFSDLERVRHEYRVGNELRVFGIRVNWMRGWDNFKEDTQSTLSGAVPGIVTPSTVLTSFQRNEPYHGNSPWWRVALFTERKLIAINGRFTYTSGQRGFVLDETAIGPGRSGSIQNQQVITFGDGRRPVATGNLNVTFLPGSKLTITNSTSVYNVRTSGNSYYTQFNNATQGVELLYFNYLGIRTISNDTDVNYQAVPWAGVFAGYQYSNRRIASDESITAFSVPSAVTAEQTNELNTGRAGLRLRPLKPLSILVSAEVGRANQPFTPIAERNYHALNGRVQYRTKSLTLAAGAESNYNFNSVVLSSFSSQSRKYFANGTWTPRSWLGFDAMYSRSHLYTIGGIAYFANSSLVQGESSLYFSNINSVVIGTRFSIRNHADLYFGYTRVEDTGDGRSTTTGAGIGSALPVFQAAQTFPMSFESPLARVSIPITKKLRFNAGYQYYGYREKFYAAQNFRANTGYSSVSWSF